MRVDDLRRLSCPTSVLPSIEQRILAEARDRVVLNIGAAGGTDHYLPDHIDQWMHARLAAVARRVVGLDIDAPAVAAARAHGFELVTGDCATVELGERFDLIVMSDVLEHLERPADAIVNLSRHLTDGGRLLITTPNATFIGNVFDALRRGPVDVYWDHVAIYLPEHVQTICDRHDLNLSHVAFFSFIDHRTRSTRLKSRLVRAVATASPRFHGHFMAEITNPRPAPA